MKIEKPLIGPLNVFSITGNVLLVAILWNQLSPLWLMLVVPMLLVAIGSESRR